MIHNCNRCGYGAQCTECKNDDTQLELKRKEKWEGEFLDRLERFASTPNNRGHYPNDDECDAFETELKKG